MDAIPASADSFGFDTYLELRAPDQDEPLRANDDRTDGQGSLNSTVTFTSASAGTYVVRARGLGSGVGDFTLRVTELPPIRDLALGGEAIVSTIGIDDPEANGRHYEEFNLRLAAGDTVQVDMESTSGTRPGAGGLDPYLAISRSEGEEPFVTNDDRGDSFDARLSFVTPAEGVYRVRAEGLAGTRGEYRLSATRLTTLPEIEMLTGDHVEGRWEDGSPATLRDGTSIRYREFRFSGTRGERIQVDSDSNLPSRLMIGRLDRSWLAERDESGSGSEIPPSASFSDPRDKHVTVLAVLPETGTYVVRTEVPAPHHGSFQLRLTRGGSASINPEPFDRARPLSGRLGPDSGLVLDHDSWGAVRAFYRLYSLEVHAGERIVITLESEDFDPVLEAGGMTVIGFAQAAYSDDADGRNSRLELDIATDGLLYLRARSFDSTVGEGRFTIRVAPAPAARPSSN